VGRAARYAAGVHRPLFTFFAAVSLMLCLALCVLWARSHFAHDRLGVSVGPGRYTVHSQGGRLVLTGPPPPGPADAERAARALVGRMGAADYRWDEWRESRPGQRVVLRVDAQPNRGTASWDIRDLPPAAMTRPLLSALDDGNKYVAAHCLLTHWVWRKPYQSTASEAADGFVTYTHNGLRIDLIPVDIERSDQWLEAGTWVVRHRQPSSWRIDPTQRPAIGDLWHDRLDVRLGSASHWLLIAPLLVLPAARTAAWLRRLARRRHGQCPSCGYDLRATPERCPECGGHADPPHVNRV
jgi:hypothetical protein